LFKVFGSGFPVDTTEPGTGCIASAVARIAPSASGCFSAKATGWDIVRKTQYVKLFSLGRTALQEEIGP
jgi:hypothetical protein